MRLRNAWFPWQQGFTRNRPKNWAISLKACSRVIKTINELKILTEEWWCLCHLSALMCVAWLVDLLNLKLFGGLTIWLVCQANLYFISLKLNRYLVRCCRNLMKIYSYISNVFNHFYWDLSNANANVYVKVTFPYIERNRCRFFHNNYTKSLVSPQSALIEQEHSGDGYKRKSYWWVRTEIFIQTTKWFWVKSILSVFLPISQSNLLGVIVLLRYMISVGSFLPFLK